MAKASIIPLLVVSVLLMIAVAESTQPAGNRFSSIGFGGKKIKKVIMVCLSAYGAEEGDTCISVAKKFEMDLESFLFINPNINCNSFYVGQWLCTEATYKSS